MSRSLDFLYDDCAGRKLFGRNRQLAGPPHTPCPFVGQSLFFRPLAQFRAFLTFLPSRHVYGSIGRRWGRWCVKHSSCHKGKYAESLRLVSSKSGVITKSAKVFET